jgi:hypothetical protein
MIYLVGGAPRTGKTILGQRISAKMKIGWISTDMLLTVLRAKQVAGMKSEWNASPEAIRTAAEWFFPCLERFIWGASSQAENYAIEGVDFLPTQIAQLSDVYQIRSVFLGCSKMTPERFDQFPGHSPGYQYLPEETRRQFAQDIPRWSEFVRSEAVLSGLTYIDMSYDFQARLQAAETVLTTS